jgi:hypothetical protein
MATDLTEANLTEANLRGVKNVSIEQLSKAKTLYGAMLDPHLYQKIKKNHQHLLQVVGIGAKSRIE